MKYNTFSKWIFAVLFISAPCALFSQTAKTRSALSTEIDSQFPSTSLHAVTAVQLRSVVKDLVASTGNISDDNLLYYSAQSLSSVQKSQTLVNISARSAGSSNLCVVASQCGPISNSLSNGTDTVRTYRIAHVSPVAVTDIQGRCVNFQISSSDIESGPGNSITVDGWVEYNGNKVQITWNGATTVTIPNGGTAPLWDPIPIDIPANVTWYTRIAPTVTSGGKWPMTTYMNGSTDSYVVGADSTNGTGALGTSFDGGTAYDAIEIVGRTYPSIAPSILCIGDSITRGQGDTVGRGGWFTRAAGNSIAWVNLSVGGTGLQSRTTFGNAFQRTRIYSDFKVALIELGINDIAGRTSTQMLADVASLVSTFTQRGIKVYVCTITPKTTSTDGFRTASAQTPTAQESSRTSYNAGVRIGIAGASGYIDIDALVEADATNTLSIGGGRWKVVNTSASVASTATSGSTTTLVDSTKSWTVNQWAGYTAIITGGTAAGQVSEISSNTSTTLTLASTITAPDATSTYVIQDVPTSDGLHPNNTTHQIIANGVNVSSLTL